MEFDDLIVVRVKSENVYGQSTAYSPLNVGGARVRTTPGKMGPLSVTSNSETEVTLVWSPLVGTSTGNSDITQYHVYWDANSGTADVLLVSGQMLSYTVSGTVGGLTYQYRVSASNVYGEGLASDVLEQVASDVPDQMEIA